MKKSKAKRKGIPFSITYEEFKRKFEEQDGKDGYTSEQMCFDYGQGRSAATGSVDRRDNDGGYTPDNIVFCRLEINSKKGNRPVGRLTEQLKLDFEKSNWPVPPTPGQSILKYESPEGRNSSLTSDGECAGVGIPHADLALTEILPVV
jgi:hypothetical protein